MKFKFAALSVFALLFIGAFVYFKFGLNEAIGASNTPAVAFDHEQWVQQQAEEDDTRINFKKDLAMIYITEFNTGALRYLGYTELMPPLISLNDETKAAYFYDQNLIPNKDTGLVVIQDAYSWDTLLNQTITTATSGANLYFEAIRDSAYSEEEQPVINDERLFLNERLYVEVVDPQGTVLMRLGEKEFRVQPGESIEIGQRQGSTGVQSTLTATHLGLWNTHNMKYVIRPAQ